MQSSIMARATILPALINQLGLNNYRFEQEIKAGNGSISKVIQTEAEISDNLINKIRLRYPEVSEDWLKTGKGKMIAKPSSQKVQLLAKIEAIEQNIEALRVQVSEIKKII